jgi:SAM-dependent methyltransferase
VTDVTEPQEGGPAVEEGTGDDAYLARVMAEIDEEVRRKRSELPARVERELDALFLEHSPMAGRGGDLADALRLVETAAFIDPVVPIESKRPAGALIKKGLRTANLWYVGWVAHQISQFAAAVSRSLRLVDNRLVDLQRQLDAVAVPAAPVVDAGAAGAWWGGPAVDALAGTSGRVLHTACGDGWLVAALTDKGVDAYGVDPRPSAVEDADLSTADLREEDPGEHLDAVAGAALGGLVLSGVVDGMTVGQREQLLRRAADRLAPEGILVVHSLAPAGWDAESAPPEADLAPGRPVRPQVWALLLPGWNVEVVPGPNAQDYLVVARR